MEQSDRSKLHDEVRKKQTGILWVVIGKPGTDTSIPIFLHAPFISHR